MMERETLESSLPPSPLLFNSENENASGAKASGAVLLQSELYAALRGYASTLEVQLMIDQSLEAFEKKKLAPYLLAFTARGGGDSSAINTRASMSPLLPTANYSATGISCAVDLQGKDEMENYHSNNGDSIDGNNTIPLSLPGTMEISSPPPLAVVASLNSSTCLPQSCSSRIVGAVMGDGHAQEREWMATLLRAQLEAEFTRRLPDMIREEVERQVRSATATATLGGSSNNNTNSAMRGLGASARAGRAASPPRLTTPQRPPLPLTPPRGPISPTPMLAAAAAEKQSPPSMVVSTLERPASTFCSPPLECLEVGDDDGGGGGGGPSDDKEGLWAEDDGAAVDAHVHQQQLQEQRSAWKDRRGGEEQLDMGKEKPSTGGSDASISDAAAVQAQAQWSAQTQRERILSAIHDMEHQLNTLQHQVNELAHQYRAGRRRVGKLCQALEPQDIHFSSLYAVKAPGGGESSCSPASEGLRLFLETPSGSPVEEANLALSIGDHTHPSRASGAPACASNSGGQRGQYGNFYIALMNALDDDGGDEEVAKVRGLLRRSLSDFSLPALAHREKGVVSVDDSQTSRSQMASHKISVDAATAAAAAAKYEDRKGSSAGACEADEPGLLSPVKFFHTTTTTGGSPLSVNVPSGGASSTRGGVASAAASGDVVEVADILRRSTSSSVSYPGAFSSSAPLIEVAAGNVEKVPPPPFNALMKVGTEAARENVREAAARIYEVRRGVAPHPYAQGTAPEASSSSFIPRMSPSQHDFKPPPPIYDRATATSATDSLASIYRPHTHTSKGLSNSEPSSPRPTSAPHTVDPRSSVTSLHSTSSVNSSGSGGIALGVDAIDVPAGVLPSALGLRGGVRVLSVVPGHLAERAGVVAGDVILSVGAGRRTEGCAQLRTALVAEAQVASGTQRTLQLEVYRHAAHLVLHMTLVLD